MAISTEDFVKQIEQMSVLDLSSLVKALEERFGVSAAAAAMPMAMPGAAAAAAAPVAEEQTEFTVVLTEIGEKKINVIKALREVTNLGLKEAKDLVEGAPQTVKEGVTKEEAATIQKKFEEAGAKVTIK
ncbi:MAG TPA: 50S ribosomal protein L7/L12 [Thermoanaerobaculia bacterium]